MEVEEEGAGDDEKQALKVQGHFFKIVKGKQFLLQSGKLAFSMTSPERETCDEWISTLQTTLCILYTKSPLFSQEPNPDPNPNPSPSPNPSPNPNPSPSPNPSPNPEPR